MATTLDLTKTYAGKEAAGYIKSAFYANDTLQSITVRENVDWKQVVRRLTAPITFGAPTCDWSPTGEVTIDERILQLKKFQIQRELCKNDFLTTWESGSEQNGQLHASLADALMTNMMAGIAQENDRVIWEGNGALTTEYDGFLTQFAADGSVNSTSGASVDDTNVVDIIKEVVGLTPIAVRRANEKPKIFVASDVAEAYRNKLASLGNGMFFYSGDAIKMTWNGQYDIIECAGMTSSNVVMAQSSNLWFGTNLLSDWNTVGIKDMTEVDFTQIVKFNAQFFAACQYGFGNEIAWYYVD
jgi:hypothetical protein